MAELQKGQSNQNESQRVLLKALDESAKFVDTGVICEPFELANEYNVDESGSQRQMNRGTATQFDQAHPQAEAAPHPATELLQL